MTNHARAESAPGLAQPVAKQDTDSRSAGNILWDVTTISQWHGPSVGIVRTERRLASYLVSRVDEGVRFVAWCRDGFRLVPPAWVEEWGAELKEESPQTLPANKPPVGLSASSPWRAASKRAWSATMALLTRIDRATTLHVWRAIRRVWRTGYRWLAHVVPALRAAPQEMHPRALDNLPIYNFKASDVYVNCGLAWEQRNLGFLAEMHRRGVKMVMFCHDIISILHPEFYPPPHTKFLQDYFERIIQLTDLFPCNSHCTERDLVAFGRQVGRKLNTGVLELGCDGVATATPDRGAHPGLQELEELRFVVMVGTFEVRKNHRLMLKVWESLAREKSLDLPPLLIIGRRGWCVDEVIAEMKKMPLYGNKIFWHQSLTDPQLAWLFKHCAFSVYPSFYEGWGLPVAEGLALGRPVLSSNTSSMPEVAKGLATLLDPRDQDAWIAAVRRAIGEYVGQSVSLHYKLRTWEDAGRDFYDMVNPLRQPMAPPRDRGVASAHAPARIP